jgi:hypothetical protein
MKTKCRTSAADTFQGKHRDRPQKGPA